MTSTNNHDFARTDGRSTRWRGHQQQRRECFVDAAVHAILRFGADVSMEQIAREAGTSKPVLYRFFSGKADLYLAVSEHGLTLLREHIALVADRDGPIRDWIYHLMDTYLKVLQDHRELYRFIARRNFTDRPLRTDPIRPTEQRGAIVVTRAITSRLRQAGLDVGGREPWDSGFTGLVQSVGDWWLDGHPMSRQRLAEYIGTFVWHAIDGALRSTGIILDPDQPLENTNGTTANPNRE